jgi:hypothetical protein
MERPLVTTQRSFSMQRSSFDFDVITGPAPARPAPKPDAKPPAAPQKPADAGGGRRGSEDES